MVEKKFCDFCGKDITKVKSFEICIYDSALEEETLKSDACRNCKEKIRKVVAKFIK